MGNCRHICFIALISCIIPLLSVIVSLTVFVFEQKKSSVVDYVHAPLLSRPDIFIYTKNYGRIKERTKEAQKFFGRACQIFN